MVAQSAMLTACFQRSVVAVPSEGSSSGWLLTSSAPMEAGLRFHPSQGQRDAIRSTERDEDSKVRGAPLSGG